MQQRRAHGLCTRARWVLAAANVTWTAEVEQSVTAAVRDESFE
jgi:hypothetical protein